MTNPFDEHRSRRALFSSSADAYERGRPGYPDRVYELLAERCGLGSSTDVLEIGPGTGQVTGRLLDHGAAVTAIELGVEFADRLRDRFAGRALQVEVGAFDEAALDPGSADLVVAATAFHWVPTQPGLQRCADVLRSRGSLALWWNCFGDPSRPDPFHEALVPMLEQLEPSLLDTPSAATPSTDVVSYGLDLTARIAEVHASGRFGPVHHELIPWSGRHTAGELRSLFSTFSPWLALEPEQRERVLDALEALARDEFAGLVERPYLTPIYIAQKRS